MTVRADRHVLAVVAATGTALLCSACLGGSSGTPANTTIVVGSAPSIGGVRLRESRTQVERRLGAGTLVSKRVDGSPSGEETIVSRVWYSGSGLSVIYAGTGGAARVFAVITRDPRYHTRAGLHVGSARPAFASGGFTCFGPSGCQVTTDASGPVTLFTFNGDASDALANRVSITAAGA